MPLQESGEIKFSEIAAEYGLSVPYRASDLYGKGNAPETIGQQIRMAADFHGTSAAIIATASAAASLDISTLFTGTWSNSDSKVLQIPSAITLGPMTVPAPMGGTLDIQNEGTILGASGGGAGTNPSGNGGAGSAGGTALQILSNGVTVTNTGSIKGGGGGGGSGGQGAPGSVTNNTTTNTDMRNTYFPNSSQNFSNNVGPGWWKINSPNAPHPTDWFGTFASDEGSANDANNGRSVMVCEGNRKHIPTPNNYLPNGNLNSVNYSPTLTYNNVQWGANHNQYPLSNNHWWGAMPGGFSEKFRSFVSANRTAITSSTTNYTGGAGGAGGAGAGYGVPSPVSGSGGSTGPGPATDGATGGAGGGFGSAGSTGSNTPASSGGTGGAAGAAITSPGVNFTLTNNGTIVGST